MPNPTLVSKDGRRSVQVTSREEADALRDKGYKRPASSRSRAATDNDGGDNKTPDNKND